MISVKNSPTEIIKINKQNEHILNRYDISNRSKKSIEKTSYKKDINLNRKEYLMAIKVDGKTQYKPILGLSTDRYVK